MHQKRLFDLPKPPPIQPVSSETVARWVNPHLCTSFIPVLRGFTPGAASFSDFRHAPSYIGLQKSRSCCCRLLSLAASACFWCSWRPDIERNRHTAPGIQGCACPRSCTGSAVLSHIPRNISDSLGILEGVGLCSPRVQPNQTGSVYIDSYHIDIEKWTTETAIGSTLCPFMSRILNQASLRDVAQGIPRVLRQDALFGAFRAVELAAPSVQKALLQGRFLASALRKSLAAPISARRAAHVGRQVLDQDLRLHLRLSRQLLVEGLVVRQLA